MVRSMKVRSFDRSSDDDWATLAHWCSGHGFPMMPEEMYPDEGFIVDDLAIAWLYQSETPIGWLEWMIVNPDKKRNGMVALSHIYDYALEKAKDLGMMAVFSSLNHESLIKLSQAKGFTITDTNMTNLVRTI